MNLAKEALQFLRTTQNGVLSTFSAKFPGYPFGSVTPFVLNHAGEPVILISTIAEHTKNIMANPKVSLLIFSGDDDLQANARLTIIGEAVKIDKEDANLRARYLRYFPQAADYFDMHDFHFYRIEIAQVRYIAGFGKMGWVAGNALDSASAATKPESRLAEHESAIIDHMNADHVASLIAYCKHFHGINAIHAQMLGIDSDGFDAKVEADYQQKILRFNFEQPVHDAQSARVALVAMSKVAKA
ncbi:MAG: pyridoxamine 5'-phosphate oxidase [Betaproteobacteria bacterium HGW-Betaproteobacteria-20]|nr:MAG: pyridoxamine 5'-phosphate oxidase [Betaproteobacteria bacterium HGW-Betaproteobacteria-20]